MLESTDKDTSDETSKNGRRLLAPRLARGVVATVFSGLCLIASLHIVEAADDAASVLLALGAMAALLSIQLFILSDQARRLSRKARFGIVGLHGALAFAAFSRVRPSLGGHPGFVAGTALLLSSPTVSPLCSVGSSLDDHKPIADLVSGA